MTRPDNSAEAEITRYLSNSRRLIEGGVEAAGEERDACGVGLIAAIDGAPRREVVTKAIDALKAVWHRGAVDADGKTGDGAGLHVQVPRAFFEEHVARTGHRLRSGRLGIGMIFLPRTDYAAQEICRTIVESELLNFGYYIYGWRQVPVDISVIGEKANATRPEIEQIMFDNPHGQDDGPDTIADIERELFIVRRRIEKRVREAAILDFYICSFSTRSLIYKGMFLAEQLSVFYPDLQDERFVSPMAIFHQRYSTNTFPTWRLAHPFRMLAHNGEINTLKGNVNWMKSHEIRMAADAFEGHEDDIKPIIQPGSSDSAALDAVFETLVRAGRSAPLAKTLLIPEAWSKGTSLPDAHKAMYAYANAVMEPWDGPAAICASDGRWVIAGLDRNGLRPLRYALTADGLLVVGSETGMAPIDEASITRKGRVGPGQMIAVDLAEGQFYDDRAIKDRLAGEYPYTDWIKNVVELDDIIGPGPEPRLFSKEELRRRQAAAGLTLEDLELILAPMAEDGKEAIGSMGDDAPLAVLSDQYRPLSHYFRQNFSQVTNPPIDSLREERVMSLKTRFRNLGNVLAQDASQTEVFTLDGPVISTGMFDRMKTHLEGRFKEIDCSFPVDGAGSAAPGALKAALERIRAEAEDAVREGTSHLILTDEHLSATRAGIPMILAAGGVHAHLVRKGLRTFTSLIVRSAECLDTHYFACLIGVGATVVNAYLAQESIADRHERGLFGARKLGPCVKTYLDAAHAGLLKIISKMGISVLSSYRGAYNFEAIGLSRALAAEFFPGMPSRISGLGLSGIQDKAVRQHARAFTSGVVALPAGGFYRYRRGGETHAHSAQTIHLLQHAVASNSYQAFKRYSKAVWDERPVSLRHLMDFRPAQKPVAVEEVESITEIRKRFVTPGMSLGALSPEAHGALNIAMNRIGAKSDSGEGGEDPARFTPKPNGDNENSAIKQIASGRFGVTAEYLNACREIEIKVAQGAKPGEGGQLPGFKVTEMIARLRHATPGVMLISPPPHHDIYSIEDLAQLIYDLKQINPEARVCVKLVASTGIGTIAAGVAKARADVILISGHVGGTGASPQTSIKYAGIPWEMGLTETNQVLTLNNLRHRVTLRTDGGLRTGRDIVMAAMMGAEEFGVGTASLVAMGCIMVRQCHSNTCPVGVCTQDPALREKFTGTPEKVVNLFSLIAEEVREILAQLGFRRLEEVIGRTDLLQQISRGAAELDDLDLNPLLVQADAGLNPRVSQLGARNEVPDTLDAKVVADAAALFRDGARMQLAYNVRNTDRAIGTRTSSHIVRRFGNAGLESDRLTLRLRGTAGQSLGAFAVQGLRIELFGEANDYVGKGLSGATIVVRPLPSSLLPTEQNTIIGNTCLYGATGGRLFAAGQAGERFAVRNSGAVTVIEGAGSNACEYMTGGVAVILGAIGDNFAAGMTGGMAFVYDPAGRFGQRVNPDSVVWQGLASAHWESVLKALISEHEEATGSRYAAGLLSAWERERSAFVQICPKEMISRLTHPLSDAASAHAAAE